MSATDIQVSSLNLDLDKVVALIEPALQGHKWSLAQLVSVFENQKLEAALCRTAVLEYLDEQKKIIPKAYFVGVTGTPGSGKSSLIGLLSEELLAHNNQLRVAVLAVDPASHISGGALLGDRTRVRLNAHQDRFYFRSQSSNRDLGGISFQTFQVLRLLRYFFDFIFIETVGIGQSEITIHEFSDHTLLVLQPLAGDQVQFLKAGIMEIPDTFIINKCDEEKLALQSYHFLRASLRQSPEIRKHNGKDPIFLTSVVSHKGIKTTAEFIMELPGNYPSHDFSGKESIYFRAWVEREYGRCGLSRLDTEVNLYAGLSLEEKQMKFVCF